MSKSQLHPARPIVAAAHAQDEDEGNSNNGDDFD
jgi:hypothetical protein